MADYDVGVLGLQTPPTAASLTPYRPAVSVRNNGIHDALASGYVRIYAAGLLVFESEVYSGTLPPGTTALAQAVDIWTPPAEGAYIVNGYVSTPLDQVEPNNVLQPTTIIVAGGPVPPPTPVEPHAPQHEEGGADEVNIDGLRGRAADPQTPLGHVASHQAGGADQLNVGSLIGELASPQTPKTHDNAYHDPVMATSDELTSHNNADAAHSAAANLANRETSGDRVGLVPQAQLSNGTVVPEPDEDVNNHGLRHDDMYGPTNPVPHHATHDANGRDEVIPDHPVYNFNGTSIGIAGAPQAVVFMPLDLDWKGPRFVADMFAAGNFALLPGPGQEVRAELVYNGSILVSVTVGAASGLTALWHIRAGARSVDATTLKPWLMICVEDTAHGSSRTYHALTNSDTPFAGTQENLVAQITVLNGAVGGSANSYLATAQQAGTKPAA